MRILLIEDDPTIAQAVRVRLQREHFRVDWVEDGVAAELALRTPVYDLVLLDLGLPRKSGLAVLTELRRRKDPVSVIIVTARDAVTDRIAGLNLGADDYVHKPFHFDELLARVHAQIRRREGRGEPVLSAGALTLNPLTHEVTLRGQPVDLSAREFSLLQALLSTPGAVLSREQLEEQLYGWGDEISSNAVEVLIHKLRRKLSTTVIRNIRGVGYKIEDRA